LSGPAKICSDGVIFPYIKVALKVVFVLLQ